MMIDETRDQHLVLEGLIDREDLVARRVLEVVEAAHREDSVADHRDRLAAGAETVHGEDPLGDEDARRR